MRTVLVFLHLREHTAAEARLLLEKAEHRWNGINRPLWFLLQKKLLLLLRGLLLPLQRKHPSPESDLIDPRC